MPAGVRAPPERGAKEPAVMLGEDPFGLALHLMLTRDPALLGIIRLSLEVSLAAVALATVLGLPVGALLALVRFPGRGALIVLINAMMGLPPVVVGLTVYLLLSRSGPLGALGLLFTPAAMVVAQTILVLPIVAALSRQALVELWQDYRDGFASLDVPWPRAALTILWDARFALVTAILAGYGRAAAEVGAIMLVGGNIAGYTRTMTTAIALETSKGDLPLALALGIILLAIVLTVNALAGVIDAWGRARQGLAT
jgi:tungstate transport system permease protein